jgi:hypothetical protein
MNYKLPEGFDFYAELNKSYQENETKHDNSCLITGLTLNLENSIKLECGHTFGYEALFNDIQESKYGNSYKYNHTKLRDHQLRCPYCRQIQDCILPYYPDVIKKRVRGVNYPFNWGMGKNECNYPFKSGKNKGEFCGKKCHRDKCHQHYFSSKNVKKHEEFLPENIERQEGKLRCCNVSQLRSIAKYHKLRGYCKLKKNDLIKKIIDI